MSSLNLLIIFTKSLFQTVFILKIILKEREEKKRLRMQNQQLIVSDLVESDPINILNIDTNELVISNISLAKDSNAPDMNQNKTHTKTGLVENE